ncbi:hypothetical protein JCM19301_4027 [Jejuia pallidilutea]|uniref:Uncharacterized protein n=1 Tax=Jejuia pallidilutea TaxID=504487 RepID=A0A090VZP3_9FLAO|nr:hypothetical protein JCM19301_4027 [Jejuia pallidilutea]GAL70131.1 hypothetical protein JCM19302_2706 [Jejuia pallidilutea]GAL88893.1 hypothetical protein JCM19538_1882 [Jejuia pallidilutea]
MGLILVFTDTPALGIEGFVEALPPFAGSDSRKPDHAFAWERQKN